MTRSDAEGAIRAEGPTDKARLELLRLVNDRLQAGEAVLATLPFASVPKRPKGPEGKVRTGIRQSWRRYRPLVVTDRRLFVFETGRTPHPREILAIYPIIEVGLVGTSPGRFGVRNLVLELPGLGPITFETGRREHDDLAVVLQLLHHTK